MKTLTPSLEIPRITKLKEALTGVPAPLGGLALSIGSLGGAWSILLPEQAVWFSLLATPVAGALVLMVLLKYLVHPNLVRKDLQHTVVSSVMPTLAMATMVIAANLHSIAPMFARSLWLTAVAAHATLFLAFSGIAVRTSISTIWCPAGLFRLWELLWPV